MGRIFQMQIRIIHWVTNFLCNCRQRVKCRSTTVDDRQMEHVNQVGHLSITPLNLLEIHEIGSVDTFESKQQNYDQIWHLLPTYQTLLELSHFSWLSHSPVGHCTSSWSHLKAIHLLTLGYFCMHVNDLQTDCPIVKYIDEQYMGSVIRSGKNGQMQMAGN